MYEIAPDQWGIFPWTPKDVEEKDAKFMDFAKKFIRMLDMAVDMLGPDMDVVESQLYDSGVMHKRFGVTPVHFEKMGEALIYTLQRILGKRSFTDKTQQSWKEIYNFMSMTMIQGAAGF